MKGSIKATGTEPESEETAVDAIEPEAEVEDVTDAEEGEKAVIEVLEVEASAIVVEEEPEEKVDYSLLD